MNASIIFLGVPLVAYVLQAVFVYIAAGRYGMALCLFAYAVANAGLILDYYGI